MSNKIEDEHIAEPDNVFDPELSVEVAQGMDYDEKTIEKIVEKPVIHTVEKVIEKPVIKYVEKPVLKKVYRNHYIRNPLEFAVFGVICLIIGFLAGLIF